MQGLQATTRVHGRSRIFLNVGGTGTYNISISDNLLGLAPLLYLGLRRRPWFLISTRLAGVAYMVYSIAMAYVGRLEICLAERQLYQVEGYSLVGFLKPLVLYLHILISR